MPSVSKVLGDLASSTGSISVAAGSNTAPAITTSGDTNTGMFFPAADTIAFAEGGAEAIHKLGIQEMHFKLVLILLFLI
jgi:hypothetical protein